jgi:hypothetical protein
MTSSEASDLDPFTGAADTSAEAEAIVVAGLRAMSGVQKFELLQRLNELGLSLALSDIRQRHPDAGEQECLLRLASRCMEPEVLRSLCGWDVEVEGY